MKKSLTQKAIGIFLIYVSVACIAAFGAYAGGVVFRQYLRIANQAILIVGFIAVLLIWSKEIPKERKIQRMTVRIIAVIVILLVIFGLFLQMFMGIDKETVVIKDGEKKIEVERSWIMFLERSYYDYKNIFWYTKDPHYIESYDDGSPHQPMYRDFYDENGDLANRIYLEENGDFAGGMSSEENGDF